MKDETDNENGQPSIYNIHTLDESEDEDIILEEEVDYEKKTTLVKQQLSKKYSANNTKVNALIKIAKSKYLCLDWDKSRYFTWDSKKKSICLFEHRLKEGSACITGLPI